MRCEIFPIHNHSAAIFIFVGHVLRLVGNVADFAIGEKQAPDRFGVGDRVYFTLLERESQFARRKNAPADVLAGINAVRAQNAIRENEGRRPHARHSDALPAQILDCPDISLRRGLDAETAFMNSRRETHVKSLLDRLQEIHDEMVRDIESAQSQDVLVVRPLAFHQFDVEALFLEETVFDRAEDWRFAGQSDIADPDLVRGAAAGGIFPATRQKQGAQSESREES